ncbi:hypothetical protein BHE90_001913 [Fusarium euwallaceae]|uniref:Cyanovirin-N domain-containing protein n=2 Tax=Fusarium solani species complex TaxID=232080 RepID=A0A3M2SHY7_9HYPO|nr:hypothetical protein CDV36_003157 [Fusarium kuroshium]RTE83535.1 hypothetical protein BHE90_001913 [Fusarium euwallaceae]
MRSILATLTMAILARGALAGCTFHNRKCEWVGTAPFCGHHADHGGHLGIDPPHQGWLTATDTEDENIDELYERKGSEFKECYNDYGKGCWTGYKALYCDHNDK